MSISPKEKEVEQFKPSITQKARYFLKGFFEKPCFYMLFTLLPAMMIGFLFDASYPWQLYVFLVILVLIQMVSNEKDLPKN